MSVTVERHRAPIAPYSCGGCVSTWTGLAMCHCSGCHETFGNITAFDRHRLRLTCRPPAERGLHLDHVGVWRTPAAEGGHWSRKGTP